MLKALPSSANEGEGSNSKIINTRILFNINSPKVGNGLFGKIDFSIYHSFFKSNMILFVVKWSLKKINSGSPLLNPTILATLKKRVDFYKLTG